MLVDSRWFQPHWHEASRGFRGVPCVLWGLSLSNNVTLRTLSLSRCTSCGPYGPPMATFLEHLSGPGDVEICWKLQRTFQVILVSNPIESHFASIKCSDSYPYLQCVGFFVFDNCDVTHVETVVLDPVYLPGSCMSPGIQNLQDLDISSNLTLGDSGPCFGLPVVQSSLQSLMTKVTKESDGVLLFGSAGRQHFLAKTMWKPCDFAVCHGKIHHAIKNGMAHLFRLGPSIPWQTVKVITRGKIPLDCIKPP